MASGDRPDTSPGKGLKPKPKKLSQKEQSERFKQAARDLGSDQSGKAFNQAINAIVKSERPDPTS